MADRLRPRACRRVAPAAGTPASRLITELQVPVDLAGPGGRRLPDARAGRRDDGLIALAGECRLDADEARAVVREVCDSVGGWRQAAGRHGIGTGEERERFAEVLDERVQTLSRLAG